jgi:DNA helicase-2/ATP-dependent DNA helicase PcrA
MPEAQLTPARRAAAEARDFVHDCIDKGKHFLVEAGAGSGKTYSLIEALKHVIKKRGREFVRQNQRVACITYTNVARDEIESRTDKHPLISAATIHAFLWSAIKDFQPFLRAELPGLGKWAIRIAEQGELGTKPIEYNLGYPKIDADKILLQHNDVISLATKLLANAKFRLRLKSAFPIIFIDEYQDTDKGFADALKEHVIASTSGPQIGLFGDHWQAIYEGVCGNIESPGLTVITKKANFRSVPAVVECLNKVRAELPQEVDDPSGKGSAQVFHTNTWDGERRTDNQWQGDLPSEVGTKYQNAVVTRLRESGWDFANDKTKVLMLTHRVLATQQGYGGLVDAFTGSNDLFVKKEDPYVKFFANVVEPACLAFEKKKFGELSSALGGKRPVIHNTADKAEWSKTMEELIHLRGSASIAEVVEFLGNQRIPQLQMPEIAIPVPKPKSEDDAEDEVSKSEQRWTKMKVRPYIEMVRMVEFIEDKTPFSTKHGVKGAEFENVLIVIGRGWNKYNFAQYLEFARDPDRIAAAKRAGFEKNRNLFYVACSRPKKNLAILFTQKLSEKALGTLTAWFGEGGVHALPCLPP